MIELGRTFAARERGAQQSSRLLTIGCGNDAAGDDAVGLEVARRLAASNLAGCAVRAMPQAGLDLMEVWDEAEVIVFVDAVSTGAQPGSLYLAPLPWPGLEPRALGSVSSHGFGLMEALALSQALGRRLPRLVLLGVEIADVAPGSGLSPAVERAARLVVERFACLLSKIGGETPPLQPKDAEFPARLRRYDPGDGFLGEE